MRPVLFRLGTPLRVSPALPLSRKKKDVRMSVCMYVSKYLLKYLLPGKALHSYFSLSVATLAQIPRHGSQS